MAKLSPASIGKTIYKSKVLLRVLAIGITSVVCFMLGLYGASAIVFKNGQYAVTIAPDELGEKSISLSETADFASPTVHLDCPGISEMTNISGESLPTGIDDVDGSHNGENYIVAEALCEKTMKAGGIENYEIIKTFAGSELEYMIVGVGINASTAEFPEEIKEIAGRVDCGKEELMTAVLDCFKVEIEN